jgi:hypothetical protein
MNGNGSGAPSEMTMLRMTHRMMTIVIHAMNAHDPM